MTGTTEEGARVAERKEQEQQAKREMEWLRGVLEGGATSSEVAAAIRLPHLQALKGWLLLDWEEVQGTGMVLFRRLNRAAVTAAAEEAALESRQRQAQREADNLVNYWLDGAVRRRREAAQNRANAAARELNDLRRANSPGAGEESPPAVLAAVLVVNAPETERTNYEREALKGADGRHPTVVVMQGRSSR